MGAASFDASRSMRISLVPPSNAYRERKHTLAPQTFALDRSVLAPHGVVWRGPAGAGEISAQIAQSRLQRVLLEASIDQWQSVSPVNRRSWAQSPSGGWVRHVALPRNSLNLPLSSKLKQHSIRHAISTFNLSPPPQSILPRAPPFCVPFATTSLLWVPGLRARPALCQ